MTFIRHVVKLTSAQAQDEVEDGLWLDVKGAECYVVVQHPARVDDALLPAGDAILRLDDLLDLIDRGVLRDAVAGDRSSSQGLQVDAEGFLLSTHQNTQSHRRL